ncbi:MAG: oxidoreductase [Dactylosporangium sp.]|nr:ferric reductase-like transmembrane domain-containing protein [Dactylosporangium sp.]NNJ62862.1 oxidoreductase [Dactylosporangium sp.]
MHTRSPLAADPRWRDPADDPLRTTTFFDGPPVGLDEPGRPARDQKPPGRRRAGNHLLVSLIFWFTLAASVEVWWLNTPSGAITGPGTAMIAAGRITGMISGFLLLVVIVTMSRVGWLEYWFGAHDLLNWHKSLGGALVVLTVAHAALLIFGYASVSRTSPTRETWQMLTTLEDMISAFIATGVLIGVGILAMRLFRRHLPYELWHLLHLSGYLVLGLGYGHQFALGAELITPGFARWYWIALHVFVAVCVVWGRAVEPLWLNLRHRFRVLEVVPEAEDWVSIYVGGRRLRRLDAQAGQYFRWRFLTSGCWWQAHPFSLSAAPNPEWLRVTVKAVGRHTTRLQHLRPGVRVLLGGPSGAFTPDRRIREGALLIAGGSGIAPIRALLEGLPAGTVLLYRASSEADLIFRDEIDSLAYERDARVYYIVGSRNEHWPKRAFTPAGLRELVPDIKRRDVYLCGPKGLVTGACKALRRLGVRRRQIHLDPFEF